jgi:hypothetical protein
VLIDNATLPEASRGPMMFSYHTSQKSGRSAIFVRVDMTDPSSVRSGID